MPFISTRHLKIMCWLQDSPTPPVWIRLESAWLEFYERLTSIEVCAESLIRVHNETHQKHCIYLVQYLRTQPASTKIRHHHSVIARNSLSHTSVYKGSTI